MKMIITFDMDNDAFFDDNRGQEVSRILKHIASLAVQRCDDDFSCYIKDFNNNSIGECYVKP